MSTGIIKWFNNHPGVDADGNDKRRYGFITPDDGSADRYYNEDMVARGIPHSDALRCMGHYALGNEPRVIFEERDFSDDRRQARFVRPYVADTGEGG